MLPDYYDIVNNGKCPFCQKELTDKEIGLQPTSYEHLWCARTKPWHIKVMRHANTKEWELIRIYLGFYESLEIDKRISFGGVRYCGGHGSISLPHFNPFTRSYDELKDKLKHYLTFL